MNTETRPTPKSPSAIWNYFAFTNENIEEMKEKDLAEAARVEEMEREEERREREERKEEEREAEDKRKASGSGDAVVPVPSDASSAANTGALVVNAGAAGERTTDENGNVLI